MHRRVIIVQARMQSQRFPGKVLQPLATKTVLEQLLSRLARCRGVDEICVATTDRSPDEAIAALAQRGGFCCFRGPADDVLARYVCAARFTRAEVIVRITADCPLADPEVIDRVVNDLCAHSTACDYASNVLDRTYPRGLDVEAFHLDTLLRMDRLGQTPAAREHVTLVARSERPELFLRKSVCDVENNADLRWTVDVPADLNLVRRLYEQLDLEAASIGYRHIVRHVREHPELMAMNAKVATWDPGGTRDPAASAGMMSGAWR